jgi:hypothetical protein
MAGGVGGWGWDGGMRGIGGGVVWDCFDCFCVFSNPVWNHLRKSDRCLVNFVIQGGLEGCWVGPGSRPRCEADCAKPGLTGTPIPFAHELSPAQPACLLGPDPLLPPLRLQQQCVATLPFRIGPSGAFRESGVSAYTWHTVRLGMAGTGGSM